MYDNPLSGRIANSIVQLMVISGNYRWLLGLRPRPHQGGCSSPLDPRLLPGSMLRIDMAWPPGKYRFQRPLLKSSSGSKGCCGTGFRTLSLVLERLHILARTNACPSVLPPIFLTIMHRPHVCKLTLRSGPVYKSAMPCKQLLLLEV